ncbi:Nup93/Nic96-domain-containing protein [Usnea florida]
MGTAGGGLFGSVSASQTQPQQTSSFFGGAQNNVGTTQPTAPSLLAPQVQPQQQQNLSGPPAQGQQQQQAGQQSQGGQVIAQPAYFDNLLEKGKKRVREADGGSDFNDLPSLQLGLGDISRRVRELGTAGRNQVGNSSAHYLLAASGVGSGTTQRYLDSLAVQQPTSENLQLYSDWDPNTHKYVEQLQQQSTLRMISEGLERAQRNFDVFLEENVDINWELQRKKIYEHFGLTPRVGEASDDLVSTPGIKRKFGMTTRRREKHNADRPGQSTLNRSLFGQSSLEKSVIGAPGVGPRNASLFADIAEKNAPAPTIQDDRFMRDKQRKFAEKVQMLNRARLAETSFAVLQELKSVESQPGGESPKQLADSYDALVQIVGESEAKERQFADEYLDEVPNSAKSVNIRKRIIDGSRRYLEKSFLHELDDLVARNPKEANIGGVPTTINKVRAYIRIRAARRDLYADGSELRTMNDEFPWPLIFFLLRSGLVKEAADYVVANGTAFRTIDRNFLNYITNYAKNPDRRLDRKIQDHINREYSAQTRVAPDNANDPYQLACYKIIGRCELTKRSIDSISQGVEDWMWLQFSLAREVSRVEESAGDVFGLEEVRESIREIGQRHFFKGAEDAGSYGTYFYLQVLGGMFERAVSYLYSYSYVAAVHFAIALDFYGLLRVSDFSVNETELLTLNTKELPQISFGRMVGFYTRDFRAGNAEAAVDYLTLICLNAGLPGGAGKLQASLCHEALRELVLETREFAQLLGDVRADGTRLKGAIEKRLKLIALADQEQLLRVVTIQAASVADDNGRVNDAVLLYHLAEDYDNVICIINRTLSEAIAVDMGQEQMRLQPSKPRIVVEHQQRQHSAASTFSLTSVDDPVLLARNMIRLYGNNAIYSQKIRESNRDTCDVLIGMAEAKARTAAGHWSEAIDIIDSLKLLPLQAHASIPVIRACANNFNELAPAISRNIGHLLLWTITCIGQQREVLASRQFGGGEGGMNKGISDELLGSARDLMVFAGLVKYRLGEKVWEAICLTGGHVGIY